MSASKGPRTKTTVRIPASLKRRIETAAATAGLDLNTWINRCLEKATTP